MMSLAGDPGSGDSDSNGDSGGPGIDDDPLASFSLSALGALGALGRVGGIGGGGGTGGQGGGGGGAGGHAERSILNDFLGQFIQSGNATTVRGCLLICNGHQHIRPSHDAVQSCIPAVALEFCLNFCSRWFAELIWQPFLVLGLLLFSTTRAWLRIAPFLPPPRPYLIQHDHLLLNRYDTYLQVGQTQIA